MLVYKENIYVISPIFLHEYIFPFQIKIIFKRILMHQESQKISVPYNGILPINIKQVPQYSPIPVSDTLVECHVWNHWTRSSVPTATTIPWNVGELIVGRSEPVWSLTASVCLPTTPMIQHGKWKFGTVVPATQTRDQVFYFQWIIQCSQSSDFFSVIITAAFLIFFFRVSYQRK